MPRLTAKQYLRTHDRLRRLWLHGSDILAEVSPADQWLLHAFFVPDRKLSDLALLAYRDAVTAQRPSLPHQAGRAVSRFWDAAARTGMQRIARGKPQVVRKRVRQDDRKLTVKALAHPEIDAHKLLAPMSTSPGKRPDRMLTNDPGCECPGSRHPAPGCNAGQSQP
jgi:hypothetical protein